MGSRAIASLLVLVMGLASLAGAWGGLDVRAPAPSNEPAGPSPTVTPPPEVVGALSIAGASFTENLGQLDNAGVRFYARGDPLSVGLTPTGALFVLRGPAISCSFTLRVEGGVAVEPLGMMPRGHATNVFRGSDPDGWVREARSFAEVVYEGVLDGVDLRFRFAEGAFKYDVLLAPGVDHDTIVMRYDGVEGLEVDPLSGDMLVRTAAGTVRDARPVVLQGSEVLESRYRLLGADAFGFAVAGEVDPALPLVIDPGLEFSTFLGGSQNDVLLDMEIDDTGYVYMAGYTNSTDFPTTSGAYKESNAGMYAAFLLKFNPTDHDLVFSTYVGSTETGSGTYCSNLILDSQGYPLITGGTNATDIPTTEDALCRTLAGPQMGFIIRLAKDGSNLLYSSYFGGNGIDGIYALANGPDGDVYITGWTNSTDLPTTVGAFCETISWDDTFMARLSPDLSRNVACTFIPSMSPWDVAVDRFGHVYLMGMIDTTPIWDGGGYDQHYDGGGSDGFVLKMDADLTMAINWTLLGGDLADFTYSSSGGLKLSDDGDVLVFGSVASTDYPVTANALYSTHVSGTDGVFSVLDGGLAELVYSTYIPASGAVHIQDVALDSDDGIAYLVTTAKSQWLPTTTGCYDAFFRGGTDGYVMGIDLSDYSLAMGTYWGDGGNDSIYEVEIDPQGRLVLAGHTNSPDLPLTSDALWSSINGLDDLYLSIIDLGPRAPPSAPGSLKTTSGLETVDLEWEPPSESEARVSGYRIYRGQTPVPEEMEQVGSSNYSTTVFNDFGINAGRYYYRVSAVDGNGEGAMSDPVPANPWGPPSAPQNLTATTGDGVVHLDWDPPIGLEGEPLTYIISKGLTKPEVEEVVTGWTDINWTDTEVEVGTLYYYRVTAVNMHGTGAGSDFIFVKVTDVPSLPTGFKVEPGDSVVQLSWGWPDNLGGAVLVGFYVYKGTTPENVQRIATLGPTSTSLTDRNVTNGQSYIYYVAAFTDVGEGDPTVALDATPATLPGGVVGFTAAPGVASAILSWSPPESDGGSRIKGYVLEWGTDTGDMSNTVPTGNVASYTHPGLVNGQTYYYRIRAENAVGRGPVSDTVSVTPMGLPGSVQDLEVAAVPTGIRVTWAAPSDTGGAETLTYRVLRGTTEDPTNLLVELVDAFEYMDDAVDRGVTYHYRVVAVSAVGEGDPGMVEHATAATAPAKIDDLAANASNAKVELTWSAPDDDGGSPVLQYVVLRGVFLDTLAELTRTATPNYADGTVQNGKTYYYQVYAMNAIGDGERSDAVEAEPLGPPPAPGVLEASAEGGAIVLKWVAPVGGGTAPVNGYRIYRGESEAELELLTEVGLVTTYTDDTVKKDRDYFYKVVATSGSGDGAASKVAQGRVKSEEKGPGFGVALVAVALAGTAVAVQRTRRR